MNTREEKYNVSTSLESSRTQRNQELYKDISKSEIDNYEIKSNATVIGSSKNNIDVEKIKSILDTHYNDTVKRKSIRLEEMPEKNNTHFSQVPFETKEYDINAVLDKAKEEKIEDYNIDRNKKLRDTQFDILNNLNLNDYIEDYEKDDEKTAKVDNPDLQRLIDTISLNENAIKKEYVKVPSTSKENADLDIFSDLKGDEKTEVLSGLKEEVTSDNENIIKEKNIVSKETKDDDFFTKSNALNKNDFEDFSDIEGKPKNVLVTILIIILVIIFLLGIYITLKSFI